MAICCPDHPSARAPDGYWDYEPEYQRLGYLTRPERRSVLETRTPTMPLNATGRFPAIEKLAETLGALPVEARVILHHTPTYTLGLSLPGDANFATELACKAAFNAMAAARPTTFVLDWHQDRPESRDVSLWYDHIHFNGLVAGAIEADLAGILTRKD